MRPLPSMTQASGGIATSFPTAVMVPRERTTVAFSIGGPATGTTLAPRMAKYCGSPPCANRDGAAQKNRSSAVRHTADAHLRIRLEHMQDSSRESVGGRTPSPGKRKVRRMRLVGSFRPVKHLHLGVSNLFRNVPFLTSLEVSPFLLICCCPWGDRRSEALRRGLCGAFRA